MSAKHPIVVITGSSGAGTTSVTRTFQHIFLREQINATIVEGDSFHRYDREQMKVATAEAEQEGNRHFCHFSPEANLLEELETLFREYGENGRGKIRKYLHNAGEAKPYGQPAGTFTSWADVVGLRQGGEKALHVGGAIDGVEHDRRRRGGAPHRERLLRRRADDEAHPHQLRRCLIELRTRQQGDARGGVRRGAAGRLALQHAGPHRDRSADRGGRQ